MGVLLSRHCQVEDLRVYVSAVDHQLSNGDWQLEAPRACASRIEVQHAILLFDLRYMTMAVNHRREIGSLGLEVELVEDVEHVDGDAVDCDNFTKRQFAR